ncbi:heme ABC transporter permease CcmC [Massilia sp. BJB1822]|uniref:heme ABC transporter permease CcmC n=1 Tax=Massilia sp. BJB1822 TaxID=2744470 RepID=UPI0015944772|nr:heme ABC transporter permease CcmC [Massilia sp. BJB1822]NVD97995.1 cytochrome c biogenesis protein CcsA [Massilia sp. BJB1822]
MNLPYSSAAANRRAPHAPRVFAYAAPRHFFPLAAALIPWFAALAIVAGLIGLYIGLLLVPADAQQHDAFRIIFVHVPAAWMSMLIYVAMAAWAGVGLVYNTRLSAMMASALAPTGALFTFLALWTGALWGKPTWGAWWVWDARLTSELILLFLYFGFMALHAAIDEPRRADRAAAILALAGVVNVPVIYFSVIWWNTLHQGASVSLNSAPSMAAPVLAGMLLMTIAFWAYAVAAVLRRVRCIMLEREGSADWLNAKTEGG